MRGLGCTLLWLVMTCPAAVHAQEGAAPLARLLATPSLGAARVGVVVQDLYSGRITADHRGDVAVVPASNMKLVTAASALELLGPDHVFFTRLKIRGRLDAGVLTGDLILEGNGDPGFGRGHASASPARWAALLGDEGVTRVTGNLVLVEQVLDRVDSHPDWGGYPAAALFVPEVAALGSGDNTVVVTVRPGARVGRRGRLSVRPSCGYVKLVNRTTTVKGRSSGPGFTRAPDSNRIEVNARVNHKRRKGLSGSASVHDPPLFLARCFRRALERAGIRLDGKIVRAQDAEGRVVAEHRTTVAAMLGACLAQSDNLIAEILSKSAGAKHTGEAGSFANASRAARAIMKRAGAESDEAVYRDGCGLSRSNRLTPRQLVRLLAWAARRPWRELFFDSLAKGGERGSTLRKRFRSRPLCDCIRAKTGYLDGVRSLSGYLRVAPDRALVFSVIVNSNHGSRIAVRRAMDRFVEDLWKGAARTTRQPAR
jgi:D-alanyl-D-alanine carboxypeptidase/D-alanyl-D-alanine-endopeptidase (penicillin-binding protein 4)